ncbi:MAG: hypothetical protein IT308_05030 [Anaerolineaceae bacterium]|nr:hypothetical protein [Anaerolineaceae bacterium]
MGIDTPTLEKSIPGRFAAEPPPAALVSAQYIYDGDGNLVKAIVNGVVTYYPPLQDAALRSARRHYNLEIDGEIAKHSRRGAETVKKFYALGSLTIAVRTISGENDTLTWVLSDHLGSLNVAANADGSWNSEIRYTAFGEVRWKDGVTPTEYGYTGQLEQAELGLYYYVARFYRAAQRSIQSEA